jgi:ATP-dependent DNA helicase RecG
MHFHGTEIQRPVPFYRIFKGNVFEQVDMATDFVMSKLNRSVGTRAESIQVPVRYEIPPEVVREAIVNAVAHRDYTSAGAVQVSVFADRVEVWNPGTLPAPLTTESLRQPHGSIPRNHRLCDALFLARYIEKYGTGTLMMIRESACPQPARTGLRSARRRIYHCALARLADGRGLGWAEIDGQADDCRNPAESQEANHEW